ncbi:electron transport complex protein RnfC [Clostridium collagenovorans DSM 3089]|uniref:Ion-translocating oxidoreductase complex subunit C n=1 Tax=Clostridium collagenovorans DSM 3089 TaxID=1121306 RepID=A0A1M5TJJ9_9CLOT|nr:electron transport complex subunit RsxC [Clostridium collagenovorans]SHH50851.1 electron transport complex protein RnfC [Clostridium collagenovorans DSM 3089]
MELLTFKRGIHPPHGKHFTENKEVEVYMPKGDLVFPMSQHIGAPCEPIVKKGDRVLVGQKIGQTTSFVCSPIHSSVSGTVKNVVAMPHSNGTNVLSVIIENDGLYESVDNQPVKDYTKLTKAELVEIIKECGIVGLGGACFPTHIKLTPPEDKKIDYIIINAAECEPYLTCDYRLMLESTDEIVEGLKILSSMFKGVKIVVGIENNKPQAIKTLKDALKGVNGVEVAPLKTKYPQGAEKQLIYAVTKREVETGKLPADAGCIVQNIGTVYAIKRAVVDGEVLTERIVTVTGEGINNPKNLKVKFGTSVMELIEECGGIKGEAEKVISGGPMMGTTLFDLSVPVIKGTSGILILGKNEGKSYSESNCIRCGRCLDACPMYLNPTKLNSQVIRGDYEGFEENNGLSCIECGCCSFVCPARRKLTQTCRQGKRTVMNNKRKK